MSRRPAVDPIRGLRSLVPLFAALLCLGPLARPTSGQGGTPAFPRYSATELAFDPGATATTRASAVNDSGEVVGAVHARGPNGTVISKPVRWKNGELEFLPTLAGGEGEAAGINSHGQIVGWCNTGERDALDLIVWHAVLWQNGTVTDLGTLGGSQSSAYAINDAGQIVGDAWGPEGPDDHAVLWQNGTITDLGTLGGDFARALAINNAGQVVGASTLADEHSSGPKPFLWQNGQMTALEGVGSSQSGFAQDINDAGQVVGSRGDNETETVLVWQNGQVAELPALGGTRGRADRIDDGGRVFGFSETDARAGRFRVEVPCMWQGGVPRPLGTVVPADARILQVHDVSPNGTLAGSADREANTRPVLLSPTGLDDGPAAVAQLALPSFSFGRRKGTGQVFLSGAPPAANVRVGLRSSKPGAARVPKFVTVRAGSRSATFKIQASSVKRGTSVTITATLGESVARETLFVSSSR